MKMYNASILGVCQQFWDLKIGLLRLATRQSGTADSTLLKPKFFVHTKEGPEGFSVIYQSP